MAIFWVGLTVILNVSAHLLAKYMANVALSEPFNQNRLSESLVRLTPVALVFGLSLMSWILALKQLPLSSAYPIFLSGLAVTPLLASLVIKESINLTQLLFLLLAAAALVLAGMEAG